ncbi:MAG TPA: ribonuclease domain-containing protein [Casimicrobiaceae bacterium]|jgi:ribonuclease T1|nr:ribonuclease domain-containing protein [Casimicrobiaceae bacterium]
MPVALARALAYATLVALVFALAARSASIAAREPRDRIDEIDVSALPAEAREVLVRIRAGGPFRYERDGVTFGNREHALPPRRRGYYHEYTVATPGERTRGGRRLVCGGPRKTPEVCYYTDDHYATFRRIRE